MRTFPGWRQVGRVMRWARQQDGVTHTVEPDAWHGHEWDRNSADIVRAGNRGGTGFGFIVDLADGRVVSTAGLNAAEALGVLAALDLIPAELAEVRDERYGRCLTCGGVLFWRPESCDLPGRWRHLDKRAYRDFGVHRAEVAG